MEFIHQNTVINETVFARTIQQFSYHIYARTNRAAYILYRCVIWQSLFSVKKINIHIHTHDKN